MNILKKINYSSRALWVIGQTEWSKTSKFDYRIVVLAALLIYFLILYISSFFGDYYVFWEKWLQVKTMYPAFADLRVLTSGFECTRQGYDATLNNPCDPWGRPSPYPRIWWSLSILGINQSHTVIIGVGMAILLYALVLIFIGKINLYKSIFYILFLCSPTAMLLVERGNNDIIVFYLFLFSVWLINSRSIIARVLSYGLIYLSMMLKLFPIFGFTIVLREKRKYFGLAVLFLLVAIAGYLFAFSDEINAISGTTRMAQYTPNFTYGPRVLFFQISELNNFKREIINIIAFIVFLPALIKIILQSRRALSQMSDLDAGGYIHAFRLGATIFIATSLVSVSWDYRLFFMLLTFPKLFDLISLRGNLPHAPVATLSFALATMYLSNIPLLDEFANANLLILYGYLFIELLPEWFKGELSRFKVLSA